LAIDVRILRYCEAIARLESFTKAAKELGVAQPALSIAVKKLEAELGVTLFERQARQVIATPEARLLLKRAARVFEELQLARQELQAAADLRIGELKVGMPPMYGLVYFPKIIAEFHSSFPSVTITAMEGSAEEVQTMLESGAIDLGMLERRRVPAGWQHVEVGRDETVLCVPKDHVLASKKRVIAQDLSGLPMVVFDTNFIQRNVLDQLCEKENVQYQLVLQSNFVPLIHQAVADGVGAATLLRSVAEPDMRVVPLSFDPKEIFHFCLCWRSNHNLTKANKAFIALATKLYRPM
jgi:LysR family transcriptional regulator, cyn operon transcriptional activator